MYLIAQTTRSGSHLRSARLPFPLCFFVILIFHCRAAVLQIDCLFSNCLGLATYGSSLADVRLIFVSSPFALFCLVLHLPASFFTRTLPSWRFLREASICTKAQVFGNSRVGGLCLFSSTLQHPAFFGWAGCSQSVASTSLSPLLFEGGWLWHPLSKMIVTLV